MRSNFVVSKLSFSQDAGYLSYGAEISIPAVLSSERADWWEVPSFPALVYPTYHVSKECLCFDNKEFPMSVDLFYSLSLNSYEITYVDKQYCFYRGRRKR